MANTVKLKRSAVAGRVPLTTDLDLGEIGVNTHDGKMFLKKDNGAASIVEMATKDFVQGAIGNHADFVAVSANRTLTAADAGKVFLITANVTITLPNSTTLTPGVVFRFVLSGSSSVTFASGPTLVTNSGGIHTGAIAGAEITLHAVASTNQYRLTQSGQIISDGTAPIYACRAWVNFDGTGTVAIRASGNVSSITDNGTGVYTVNFATALPDANYSIVGSHDFSGTAGSPVFMHRNRSTGSVQVALKNSSTTNVIDSPACCVAIFR